MNAKVLTFFGVSGFTCLVVCMNPRIYPKSISGFECICVIVETSSQRRLRNIFHRYARGDVNTNVLCRDVSRDDFIIPLLRDTSIDDRGSLSRRDISRDDCRDLLLRDACRDGRITLLLRDTSRDNSRCTMVEMPL